jgi:glycosyltransferase involved in cell wall biosynthesis
MKSAVCLIVRNEVRDIQEWMAFHALAGFDTQLIFDNASDDGTADLIRAARRRYDVRFHHWENRSQGSQVLAYWAACEAYKLEFDWIAFIDSDEFLVTSGDATVNQFFARFEGWSAIAINWAVYGANGHEEFPPGLVVENFTRRADEGFFPARHVKSIIRPRLAVRCCNPHYFKMHDDFDGHYCDPYGNYMLWFRAPAAPGGVLRGVSRAAPDYAVARINHYFTRSRAHWLAKLARGYPSDVAVRKMEEFDQYNRNEVADPIALRGVDVLRAEVAALREGDGRRLAEMACASGGGE